MAIKRIGAGAYFVVDVFSYRAQIHQYDPHVTSQTLISFADEPEAGLAVLEEKFGGLSENPDDYSDELSETPLFADTAEKHEGDEEAEAQAELDRITPTNAELLRLAERFPAPQEWYDE
ncbi:MAG: hypothetical protein ACYTG0_34575 [Planctomycetota bacterium]|jgi:hypothetical protein